MRKRYTTFSKVGALALCLWSAAGPATAQEEEEATHGWSGSFDYWAEVFSNLEGGIETGTIAAGLANLNLDFTAERFTFHANLYGPHGDSVSEKVGDFSVVSNIDTVDDPRLQELWGEVPVGAGSSLRFGMLAADTEFWGTEYGGLFVNSVFGAPTHISGNLPGPSIFPVATFGLRWAKELSSGTTFRAAILDGDAGDPEEDNRYGLDVELSDEEGALLLFEVQGDRLNRFGSNNTLRLSAYAHTGEFRSRDGDLDRGNWGLLAVVDWALAERLGWFGRLSWANDARSLAPVSVETGVNIAEFAGSPGTFGVGIAYVELNGRLAALEDPALSGLSREIIVELTYEQPLGKYFALQPDIQYIVSPGGDENVDNALVIGLRGKLALAF